MEAEKDNTSSLMEARRLSSKLDLAKKHFYKVLKLDSECVVARISAARASMVREGSVARLRIAVRQKERGGRARAAADAQETAAGEAAGAGARIESAKGGGR